MEYEEPKAKPIASFCNRCFDLLRHYSFVIPISSLFGSVSSQSKVERHFPDHLGGIIIIADITVVHWTSKWYK